MNLSLSNSDLNFIICTISMIIIAVYLTITLNKIAESNKKLSGYTKINHFTSLVFVFFEVARIQKLPVL